MSADIMPDLDPILPSTATVTVGGVRARVNRLRAREVFELGRVLGSAIGQSVGELSFDLDDPAQARGEIIGVVVMAASHAPDEMLAFLRGVVVPVDDADQGRLRNEFANPDLGELLDIVEVLIDQEAETLVDLVGKARRIADKTATLFRDRRGPTGRGPGPSTSSKADTDGQTG